MNINRTNQYCIEAGKLFKTPFYLYDFSIIDEKISKLEDFFYKSDVKILYAMKANSSLAILKHMNIKGLGFDACSTEELFLLKELGINMNKVYYNSDCVDIDELIFASKLNANIIVGSIDTLELFCKENLGASIGLRVNTGHGAGHSPLVTTGGVDSKFGIHLNQLQQAIAICEQYGVSIVGLHTHAGSGMKKWQDYVENARRLVGCIKDIIGLKYLNFGGGFDVKYNTNDDELDFIKLCQEFFLVIATARNIHPNLNVFIEPGRYLVANSGVLLTSAVTVKQNEQVSYVGLDTGFNHFARCFLYNSFHEIINLTPQSNKEVLYDIVGNLCQSGDVFARKRALKEVVQGDLLCIKDVGAYGFAMSSNFNSRRKLAEVALIDTKFVLIRQEESFDSLLLNQHY